MTAQLNEALAGGLRRDSPKEQRAALATRLDLSMKQLYRWLYTHGSVAGGKNSGASGVDDEPRAAPAAPAAPAAVPSGIRFPAAVRAQLKKALAAGLRHDSPIEERSAISKPLRLTTKQLWDWLYKNRNAACGDDFSASDSDKQPAAPAAPAAPASDDDEDDDEPLGLRMKELKARHQSARATPKPKPAVAQRPAVAAQPKSAAAAQRLAPVPLPAPVPRPASAAAVATAALAAARRRTAEAPAEAPPPKRARVDEPLPPSAAAAAAAVPLRRPSAAQVPGPLAALRRPPPPAPAAPAEQQLAALAVLKRRCLPLACYSEATLKREQFRQLHAAPERALALHGGLAKVLCGALARMREADGSYRLWRVHESAVSSDGMLLLCLSTNGAYIPITDVSNGTPEAEAEADALREEAAAQSIVANVEAMLRDKALTLRLALADAQQAARQEAVLRAGLQPKAVVPNMQPRTALAAVPAAAPAAAPVSAAAPAVPRGKLVWSCGACGAVPYAWRQACNKCRAPKPADARIFEGDWSCRSCNKSNAPSTSSCWSCFAPFEVPQPRDDEWLCACSEVNFLSRGKCRQCNKARPQPKPFTKEEVNAVYKTSGMQKVVERVQDAAAALGAAAPSSWLQESATGPSFEPPALHGPPMARPLDPRRPAPPPPSFGFGVPAPPTLAVPPPAPAPADAGLGWGITFNPVAPPAPVDAGSGWGIAFTAVQAAPPATMLPPPLPPQHGLPQPVHNSGGSGRAPHRERSRSPRRDRAVNRSRYDDRERDRDRRRSRSRERQLPPPPELCVAPTAAAAQLPPPPVPAAAAVADPNMELWCYRTVKKGLQKPQPLWVLLAWRAELEPKGRWQTTTAWRQGEDEATCAKPLSVLFP